ERPADQVLAECGLARAGWREGDRVGERLLLRCRMELQAIGRPADGLEQAKRSLAPIRSFEPVRLVVEAVEAREVLGQKRTRPGRQIEAGQPAAPEPFRGCTLRDGADTEVDEHPPNLAR